MALNLRIIQWRKKQNMTQAELAKRCDTTQQTIAKIEQGLVDPKLSTLEKISVALGCELPELFYCKRDFARDVNAVAIKLGLNLAKVRSIDLNQLCWREGYIPPYHPFWSQYKVKENKVFIK